MASLFQVPTPVLGLMGQRRRTQQDPLALLAGMQGVPVPPQYEQAQFDAGDQQFLDRYAAQGFEGSAPMAAQAAPQAPMAAPMAVGAPSPQIAPQAAPVAPAAPRQRERVSGWRLLDRVLGGETITEGLDNERTRLQAEAMRPEMEAQQARLRALASGFGPEAELAFALNPTATGEAFASNLEGYTLGAGGLRGGVRGIAASAPTFTTVNDDIFRNEPGTGRSVQTATASPAYSDITARYNAENPTVGANSRVVNLPTGNVVAEGYIAPEVQNVAPGAEALVFENGRLVNRVGSTQQRPISDADQAAIARAEAALALSSTAVGRAQRIISQIDNGDLNLGPMTNAISEGRNRLGQSDANSLNYEELRNWAKEARDAILSANTGVQTDQDAIRALDRILSSAGDERVVRQSIERFVQSTTATQDAMRRDIARRSGQGAPAAQDGGISREAAIAEARRRGLIP